MLNRYKTGAEPDAELDAELDELLRLRELEAKLWKILDQAPAKAEAFRLAELRKLLDNPEAYDA
jgi:hypothetical protein